ncbi:hypothetical protein PIROE2DRAFT_67252 [Piromyces sp. E2]|nr:hypothetical protein PIROE2DRAFT_67252 [Piromyces sp. E2]|eukprot:OUM65106.1 hypothetical protein PIROE2DRAFT_67252 [Piromyces sp. E2]
MDHRDCYGYYTIKEYMDGYPYYTCALYTDIPAPSSFVPFRDICYPTTVPYTTNEIEFVTLDIPNDIITVNGDLTTSIHDYYHTTKTVTSYSTICSNHMEV